MQTSWFGSAVRCALIAAAAFSATSSKAQDLDEYRRFREARFAEVHKANPQMMEQVAEVKAATAVLVAKAPARLAAVAAPPSIWRVPFTLPFIYDIPVAPRMVIVPAGEVTLGSPSNEPGRARTDQPRRRVRIAQAFAVGMFPITFAEFSLFVAETGQVAKGGCVMPRSDATAIAHDWRSPGFAQTFRSPAVCIGVADAQTYAAWLSQKTGHRYRLLSATEYEYAARGGTNTAYWWGDDRAAGCALTNLWNPGTDFCNDHTTFTAELGAGKANGFGLFDMAGNVASWTADCRKGRAAGRCRNRVVMGASWATSDPRSAARRAESEDTISADLGFRLARDL